MAVVMQGPVTKAASVSGSLSGAQASASKPSDRGLSAVIKFCDSITKSDVVDLTYRAVLFVCILVLTGIVFRRVKILPVIMGVKTAPDDISLQRCPDIVIKVDTPKGRGVFATKDIPARTIIDVCPVLILGIEENKKHIENTSLYHYTYNWPIVDIDGNSKVAQAVIFGLGSMFNHSTQEQNVGWMRDTQHQIITYRALRDIPAGEELCISYGSHLTFKDADIVPPTPPEDEIEQLRMIEPY